MADFAHGFILACLHAFPLVKAREMAVPTDDMQVRARLRELDEPMTLFGEDKAARRDRLKDYLAGLGDEVSNIYTIICACMHLIYLYLYHVRCNLNLV